MSHSPGDHVSDFQCGHCEQVEDKSQRTDATTREGDPICSTCLKESYVGCDDCGAYVLEEEAFKFWDAPDGFFYRCKTCTSVEARRVAA